MISLDQRTQYPDNQDQLRAAGVDASVYRRAMRSHAAAVTIISTGRPGERTGLTATSVCSLSDSPPTLIVCINRNASAHDLVRSTGAFGVNALRREQVELANTFAGRRAVAREQRFAGGVEWISLITGAPILAQALVGFDCELVGEYSHETHSIFIGRVRAVKDDGFSDPLIYFGGAFHAVDDICQGRKI